MGLLKLKGKFWDGTAVGKHSMDWKSSVIADVRALVPALLNG